MCTFQSTVCTSSSRVSSFYLFTQGRRVKISKGSSIGLGVTRSEQAACWCSYYSSISRLAARYCWLVGVGVIDCCCWWWLFVVTNVLKASIWEDRAFMLDVSIPAISASVSVCSSLNRVLLAVIDELITAVSVASTVCRKGPVTACS